MTLAHIYRDDPAYAALNPSQARRARQGGMVVDLTPRRPMSDTRTLVLVDLSNLVHREYAMRKDAADVDETSRAVVEKIRRYAHDQPHVAICCDSGKSFRKAIDSEYKAQRGEREPALYHQMRTAIERLKADGFPVWAVPEMEADDIIATATMHGLRAGLDVLIVTSDKDLTQMICPRVTVKRPDTGDVVDEAGVVAKFGVGPSQMLDYLCLVGDASDNIKGAKGVGPKTAAKLLTAFGSLDEVLGSLRDASPTERTALGFTPALATSLEEFASRVETVRQLVTLRTDVDIPFDEVFQARVSKAAAEYNPEADYAAESGEDAMPEQEQSQSQPTPADATPVVTGTIEPAETPTQPTETAEPSRPGPAPVTAMVPRETEIAHVEYERALDPRSMQDARILAKDLHQSLMFSGYGSPQAVLSTVMLGRELGLPAIASLRGVHSIDGRHALSAQTMVALVLKSGFAEYFEADDISDTAVTYVTKRKGARKEQRLTHTIEMARVAFVSGRDPKKVEEAWEKSGWGKNPVDMLVARASSRLARLVYPDIVGGLYTPEELREVRDSEAQAS